MKIIFRIHFLLSILFIVNLSAQKKALVKYSQKDNLNFRFFNANNISTTIYNNGYADYQTYKAGLEFRKGEDRFAVYMSGLLWGAKINGEIRVGGGTYNNNLQPGKINEDGTAEDSDSLQTRVFRVSNSIDPLTISLEAKELNTTEDEIIQQYQKDWDEWPAYKGAPFVDVDNDGEYNPDIDIPGVKDATQTLWFVANDLDTVASQELYNVLPMGVELQVTVWGYSDNPIAKNTLFKRYKLINKSNTDFEDMYISYWADPDIGYASDDYMGCDTSLSLMFAYNGNKKDDVYKYFPPSIGYSVLQGPIIKSPGDTAFVGNKILPGYKNLGMTSHTYFTCGNINSIEPPMWGNTFAYWYNIMSGKNPYSGTPFTDPLTKENTMFTLSGDPVTGTGWIGSTINHPCDGKNILTSGPFTLAVSDTQEIVLSESGAFGKDNLDAITNLKETTSLLHEISKNSFIFPSTAAPGIVNSSISEKARVVKITWEKEDQIELFNKDGFKFQGYNIYQFGESENKKINGVKVATFDIVDGVKTISQLQYNYQAGKRILQEVQDGNDTGLEYSFTIEKDYVNNSKLLKGNTYYFGVVPYTYNPDSEIKTTEGEVEIKEFTYRNDENGFMYNDALSISHVGNSTCEVTSYIVDPDILTGDNYEISFYEQIYFLDNDDKWKLLNPDKSTLNKDSSSVYLNFIAYESPESFDFTFELSGSPDQQLCDGIKLTFPQGTTIIEQNPYGGTVDSTENSVQWLLSNNVYFKTFEDGGNVYTKITKTDLPFNINFELSGTSSGNISGSFSINEIPKYTIPLLNWKLTNTTADTIVALNQSWYNGREHYPVREYESIFIKSEPIEELPVFEGFKLSIENLTTELNNYDKIIMDIAEESYISISSYYNMGWKPTSRSIDTFGNGETADSILSKDYELRFTGEYLPPDSKGIIRIKEGTGSIATIYGARYYSLADHPMNPVPNSETPFTVRIPFEIWNIDDNQQVNVIIYDRKQTLDSNPFYAFNPTDRMYIEILNTPYSEDVQNVLSDTLLAQKLTWNLIFLNTDYNLGDKVKIIYPGIIKYGIDKYSFSTYSPDAPSNLPKEITLYQNYPNPFNPTTTIKYTVPVENDLQNVKLSVYDILGRLVATLVNKQQKLGNYEVEWNANNFSSGIYIYRLQIGGGAVSKKMLLIK